ncbi:SDR family NAD(P)-dependent oxidoreductase [Pectinatus frisingensis]|uniref:SDR family NAD(P)-dependent oxidoreductase n=1 Tax=Pectinatus frisingensis TaxID=865 RepID=UPI001E4045C7|nr:SDR family NAD(P)-dependent oxidoreductase [Pectinatus frisingensis]
MFKDKNILITGGMGFIGSNLAIKLVKEGANVTILDSMLDEYGANLYNIKDIKDKVQINFSDMRDEHSLRYLVRGKNYIFNLAGQVSHQDSMRAPLMDLEVNVKAQLNLLEICRLYAPKVVLIYSSTRQIYGHPRYLPVDEEHPLLPPDINGINKLAAEYYHQLYYKVYGLKTVCLRLTNTYGPHQLIKNSRQGFIGWFVNRAILGQTIKLFGTGKQIRDFNYVDDVVNAMCGAALSENTYGNIYNLSGPCASLKKVAELLIKYTGKGNLQIVPFPEERKKIDIGDFYGDSNKLKMAIGWEAKVSLEDGLRKMIDYYQENKDYYLE